MSRSRQPSNRESVPLHFSRQQLSGGRRVGGSSTRRQRRIYHDDAFVVRASDVPRQACWAPFKKLFCLTKGENIPFRFRLALNVVKLTKCRSLFILSVLKLPLRMLATSRISWLSEKSEQIIEDWRKNLVLWSVVRSTTGVLQKLYASMFLHPWEFERVFNPSTGCRP